MTLQRSSSSFLLCHNLLLSGRLHCHTAWCTVRDPFLQFSSVSVYDRPPQLGRLQVPSLLRSQTLAVRLSLIQDSHLSFRQDDAPSPQSKLVLNAFIETQGSP